MWTCVTVLALAVCAGAITRDQFYPHGQGLDQRLPRGSEIPSPEVHLKVPIVFYGEIYETVFVNNYGVLSFRADIPSFLNSEFPLPYPSIAAFYTNVDTSQSGTIYYRETDEPHVLSKAEESVQNNFHEYYDFKPTSVFIATWLEVTYNQRPDRTNTFQIAVISNGNESFVELLYPEREIQWIQREAQLSSLPDAKAQAGFVAEDGRIFTLRGSGSHQIRNIVTWSNTHEPGKYVFRVGNIPQDGNIAVPDQYNQYDEEVEEESKTCAQSGPSVCHIQAKCVDYQAGICCQCNDGYYGNGKSCIKDDVPIRVHGKLNGIVNDVSLNDVDIQAYVVVADGRSYTALSQGPPSLGSSLQLLNVLGGVVGWLFAKPSERARNGYQLTGAYFNHSADVLFPATGDRVTINQEFIGHDVFDQIALETDIRGTIPVILSGTKLEITEYEEQYTLVETGLIRSESTRTFTNKVTGEKYEQRVSQTFTFNPCRFAPPSEEDSVPLTLKVVKNYLGYETNQNIVRYGMSNKISPLGQEDPCIQGRRTCGPHSTCVVKDDSFSCICQSGYTNIYLDNTAACVDVDECAAGTHNCDTNGFCLNHDGGFQCLCRSGYEGDGVSCNRIPPCRYKKCGPNAQCIENFEDAYCTCNPGFQGDGQDCLPSVATSAPCDCSPYAYCDRNRGCVCYEGYEGDGRDCVEIYSEQTTVPAPIPIVRPTPTPTQPNQPSTSEADYNDTFVLPNCDSYGCVCPPGYSSYKDDRNNDLCRIDSYRPTSPATNNPDGSEYRPPYPDTNNPDYRPPSPDTNNPDGSEYRPPYPDTNNPDGSEYRPPYPDTNNPDYRPPYPNRSNPDGSEYRPPYPDTNNPDYRPPYPDTNNPDGSDYRPPYPDTNNPDYRPPSPDTNYPDGSEYRPPYPDTNNPDGSYYRPPSPDTNSEYNDTSIRCDTDSDCPPNAVCYYSPTDPFGTGHCMCPEGYEGDAYECIERTGSCSCGVNAHCIDNAAGESMCVCDAGYHGDGYSCRPNFSCTNNSDCEYHAECRPDSGSGEYVCQCIEGYIKDQNDACIPDGQLCNGALCAEHASCLFDDTIGVSYCHCDPGYEGEGITQCVPQGTTCDVTNDCHPNALCTPINNSYQCVCNEGYTGDGYHCTLEANCRNHPYMCDAHASCLKRHDAYVCECNTGYNGNGSSCALNPRQAGNFLIASDGASVYRVPFKVSPRDSATPINSAIYQIAVGIDVDCNTGRIYWGDVVGNAIRSAAYDGSSLESFTTYDVKSPEGVSIDWSARNIFWTDSKKLTIEVASLETKIRKVLFSKENIYNPRGIVVHPQRGKIFWSDWNRSAPKIEWANMDGTQRGIFLDQSEVKLPNSLAIDWARDRLCYADAGLFHIKCVGIDTLDREIIANGCSYPFGLAINGNTFYWTDWKTLKIEYIDTLTQQKGQVPISTASRRLYGVAVAPDQCPASTNVCQYRNGNCNLNQLCLPDGRGGRTCADAEASPEEDNKQL